MDYTVLQPLIFASAISVYFTPLMIAYSRGHKQALILACTTVFLGWTIIAWYICFWWALFGESERTK